MIDCEYWHLDKLLVDLWGFSLEVAFIAHLCDYSIANVAPPALALANNQIYRKLC